jgi:imidazole glycerol-phosphate synthase subunit HisF
MFRPRIIPVLLLRNKGLVKTIKFDKHRYIGDPINAVKIFNDLKADELVFLDILANKENRTISLDFVKKVGEEANMPFSVGGGITTLEQIRSILRAGAEKVIINTNAFRNPDFILTASETFGSSTIVVCIDVKKRFTGKEQTWILNGSKPTGISPGHFAQQMEEKGAGEIIIQSIDKDGTMNGYDIPLIRKISQSVRIPVVALGGAGNLGHMKQAYGEGFANGLAAGSMFVYHGARNGILINYPEKCEISKIFNE